MKNKQIIFTAPRRAELLETELEAVAEDEVLVEVAFSTISNGTERANVSGDPTVSYTDYSGVAKFPRTLGYSTAGVVIEVGKDITSVVPGDRVAVSWAHHAKYNKVKECNVHKIESDGISLAEAAIVHIACFPMAAIRKCHLEIGEPAIVMGLGLLGLMGVQLLRAAGAVPVIAVDPIPEKREEALGLGADYALDPFDPDFAATVKRLTHGGAKVGLEVTGVGAGLNGILDCMAPMGRVALLGCTRNSDFSVDYYRKVHGPGISLIGAHTVARPKVESSQGLWTTHDDMMAILRLIAAGRVNLVQMVAETHRPEECQEIYDRLMTDKLFPLVQYDWREVTV